MEKYHRLSDATMDNLLEDLENLLDEIGSPDYEVEYHVCHFPLSHMHTLFSVN